MELESFRSAGVLGARGDVEVIIVLLGSMPSANSMCAARVGPMYLNICCGVFPVADRPLVKFKVI
jgi:hypothetical protein